MAKLTKAETKQHNQIMDLLHSDKPLTEEEKMFIIENFHEGSTTNNGELGAFFTPLGLAFDFVIDANTHGTVIDLCAGIGGLSFAMLRGHYSNPSEIVCVELNHTYYELGKRIVPEATWINGDALTTQFDRRFDVAISNPPFGRIKTSDYVGKKYTGAEFEYKIIERASEIADRGVFILPQSSAAFRYSGQRHYFRKMEGKCQKFVDQTGFYMEAGCGVDTGYYLEEWKGVKPMCEVVCIDFVDEDMERREADACIDFIEEDVQPEPEKVNTTGNFTFVIE